MIIRPKIRGFICLTAHPKGCEAHVWDQIHYAQSQRTIAGAAKKVLVIGASTGYGLATRVVASFSGGAETVGVFFERPPADQKTASAGWYNSVAFERAATAVGLKAYSVNGDAFATETKEQVWELIKSTVGQVDAVIYSLAAPRRTFPDGSVRKSVLKPIGKTFSGKNLDTDHNRVFDMILEPATETEIDDTVKVMGGEDWKDWIVGLDRNSLLANGVCSAAYSYVGPPLTWPIYRNGTIGRAKDHLHATAVELDAFLSQKYRGRAFVSINKAVVTQASSSIPIVPLYLSILLKVMAQKGINESCVRQIYRLWSGLNDKSTVFTWDDNGRARLDDLELRADVQEEVSNIWGQITTDNLRQLSDLNSYKENFLKLFGFGWPGVDETVDVSVDL
jgi:enoyl-[acyl-carrier protein] reductase/trans-2-enoyl-CoA reductase (NAD+)